MCSCHFSGSVFPFIFAHIRCHEISWNNWAISDYCKRLKHLRNGIATFKVIIFHFAKRKFNWIIFESGESRIDPNSKYLDRTFEHLFQCKAGVMCLCINFEPYFCHFTEQSQKWKRESHFPWLQLREKKENWNLFGKVWSKKWKYEQKRK